MHNKNTSRSTLTALFATALFSMTGCMTAPEHRSAVEDSATARLTVGTVQQEIRPGMSGAEVVAALGAPNIVTTDETRREVWVYDKVASEVVSSATSLRLTPFIFGSGGSVAGGASAGFSHSAGASSRSDRTLTIVIKFDEQKRVRDYAYHASQF